MEEKNDPWALTGSSVGYEPTERRGLDWIQHYSSEAPQCSRSSGDTSLEVTGGSSHL